MKKKKKHIYIYITESLHCTTATNTMLEIKYISIINNFKFLKIRKSQS